MDDHQIAVANQTIDARLTEIAGTLAKAGWRSPLEPLANGDIRAAWAKLSLMQKRATGRSLARPPSANRLTPRKLLLMAKNSLAKHKV